ncbi:MAG: class I SAM-dependent methyltransferase [Planctomycetes bacterium]|nr:class I SAM-dependent methyltransferase [Planctomycetota bacterium]
MGHRANEAFDFGAVADKYDRWYDDAVGAAYDRLEKKALGQWLPPVSAGRRLLEVGCGTGHWSEFFARRGFDVTGIDISPEMISVADGKGISAARFYVSDAVALEFDDGSFDAAVAVTVLGFVEDPQRVLAEMARVVRPGGEIVIGALNLVSPATLLRRLKGSELVASSRFLTPWRLRRLLARFGRCEVKTAAFMLPWRSVLSAASVTDFLGRTLALPFGDFIVGRVHL